MILHVYVIPNQMEYLKGFTSTRSCYSTQIIDYYEQHHLEKNNKNKYWKSFSYREFIAFQNTVDNRKTQGRRLTNQKHFEIRIHSYQ